ncbi:MAG TPA: hypothetical protein PKN32_04700 [Bacteroidales bacterium]|nr:hypothetical protein [Bacteroidales bacterium]
MKIINHRVNTVSDLKNIVVANGVEVDIRDYKNHLVLSHDPFIGGELFEEFLSNYNHSTLILNSKSEGIEFMAIELLKKYNIEDYFFLDCSFAMINKFIEYKIKDFAVRFSEFESLGTVRNFVGLAKWVWVDCFKKSPINKENFFELKKLGFSICIVSPDLVGKDDDINDYIKFLEASQIIPDAVCVKQKNEKFWNV